MKRFTRFFNYLKFGSGGLLAILLGFSTQVAQAQTKTFLTGQKTGDRFNQGLGNGNSGITAPFVENFGFYQGASILNSDNGTPATLTAANTLGIGALGVQIKVLGADVYAHFRNTNNANLGANTTTYFKIKEKPSITGIKVALSGVLGLEELKNITGRGYSGASNFTTAKNEGSAAGTSITNVLIDKLGEYYAAVTTNAQHNSVRLSVQIPDGLLDVNVGSTYTVNVYNAFTETNGSLCSVRPRYTSPGAATGINLAAGVTTPLNLNQVLNNPQFAIDDDPTTASTFLDGVANIGVGSSISQRIYFDHLAPATDEVKVHLGVASGLVSADVLSGGVSFRFYNGETQVGTVQSLESSLSLLNLNLAGLVTVNGYKDVIATVKPGVQFNRIEVVLNSGLVSAGVLGGALKLYDVSLSAPVPTISSTPALGAGNSLTVYSGQTIRPITATSAGNNILWYVGTSTTAIGPAQASPYNLPVTSITTPGDYTYYAASQSSEAGCINTSAKVLVNIKVLASPTYTNPTFVIAGNTYSNADRRIVVAGQSGNNYTFSNPSNVPAGLTLNANGNITGSPTGTYPVGPTTVNFTANVTDATLSLPVATARQFSIVVYPALTSNAGTFPNGVANTAYGISAVPAPAGGSGTYSYVLQSGSLPTGLQVSNTGVISGTPTTAGTYNFTIRATDTVTGQSVDHSYTNVVIYSTLVANAATLPNGIETVAYGATAIPAPTGGSGPFEYTLSSGELPEGLGLTLQGGITGTPTADGVYNFTITVSNPTSGQSVQQIYSNVVIYEKLIANSATLPNTNVGINPYPATAVPVPSGGSGVTAEYTYSVIGSVPTGVTISPSGAISGAPTTVGTYAFTVTITDPTTPSQSVIQSYTVEIGEGLVANNTPLPNSYVGISPYPATSVPVPSGGSGEVANYTYTTSGNLPTGVTINQQGVISGNPTAAGTYQFSVLVNDPGTGLSVTQSYEVIIGPALVANAGTLPSSFVDGTYSSTIPVPTGGSGATGDYVYTTSGAVPPGLEVSGSGSVTGSPTTAGTFSFSVTINDPASGLSVSQPYSVVISPKLLLPGGVYPTAYVNQTSYSQPISVAAIENGSTNGSAIGGIVGGTLTYSLTPPVVNGRILALPTGFDLAPDGTLSGDPSAAGISTNTFTVYVTDGQQVASNDYTLIVESSLPVKLASFKVAKEGDVAQLLWSTTSESNSASFEVQRSRDGKEWKAIGSRDAKGESAAIVTYNFTDANPFDGENLYRLKMIDKDATFALSTIQSVSFAIESLKLYPNPVANSEPLNIQVKDWGLVKTVKVFNALGKVVFESAGDVKSVVSTEQLTAGLYVVQVTRKDGQVVSSKFVKR